MALLTTHMVQKLTINPTQVYLFPWVLHLVLVGHNQIKSLVEKSICLLLWVITQDSHGYYFWCIKLILLRHSKKLCKKITNEKKDPNWEHKE